MSQDTSIEYADSSLNLMMGCDGCELWNRAAGNLHCYAGEMTDHYGGRKGWPDKFEQPKIFMERLDKALRWSDLSGKDRPHKPWLNGRPRVIFLNDMGDTFTESLPLDWLAPALPRLATSPHIFLLLTKRARRMIEFSRLHPLPENVWPGVSVTSGTTCKRAAELMNVIGGRVKWVSVEPMLESMYLLSRTSLPWPPDRFWVVAGGESGPKSRPCDVAWIRSLVEQCKAAAVPAFVKQLGSRPEVTNEGKPWGDWPNQTIAGSVHLRDPKGGDPSEWPEDLRVREFPDSESQR